MPRVTSLPNECLREAVRILREWAIQHGVDVESEARVSMLKWVREVKSGQLKLFQIWYGPFRPALEELEQAVADGAMLTAFRRDIIKRMLMDMNLPTPDALSTLFSQVELDWHDMYASRQVHHVRLRDSPIHTRLVVHPGQRHEKGPLEQMQLWKRLPVDALVTLVGCFVSAHVTPRRGLKRRAHFVNS